MRAQSPRYLKRRAGGVPRGTHKPHRQGEGGDLACHAWPAPTVAPHSPGGVLSGTASRWVPRLAGCWAPQWVTRHASARPCDPPSQQLPDPNRCEDDPEPYPTAVTWATRVAHSRVSHSRDGHKGVGRKVYTQQKARPRWQDVRPSGAPQRVQGGRISTTTHAVPLRGRVRAWGDGLMFNGRTLGRRERGVTALTRRKIRPHPMETCHSSDGASR